MARVWPDTAVQEANLSVTVAALRRALGDQDSGRSWIETVPRRGYRFDGPVQGPDGSEDVTLAVLPFEVLGAGAEPHVGLGLADALISRLTGLDGLRVRPTAAVTHLSGQHVAPHAAAVDLGVDAVLTGTVRQSDENVRLSLQLVPAPGRPPAVGPPGRHPVHRPVRRGGPPRRGGGDAPPRPPRAPRPASRRPRPPLGRPGRATCGDATSRPGSTPTGSPRPSATSGRRRCGIRHGPRPWRAWPTPTSSWPSPGRHPAQGGLGPRHRVRRPGARARAPTSPRRTRSRPGWSSSATGTGRPPGSGCAAP